MKRIILLVGTIILLNCSLKANHTEAVKELNTEIIKSCNNNCFNDIIFKRIVIEELIQVTKDHGHLNALIFNLIYPFPDIKKIIINYAIHCVQDASLNLSEDELTKLFKSSIKQATQLFLNVLEPKKECSIEHNKTGNYDPIRIYCLIKQTYGYLVWVEGEREGFLGKRSYYKCNVCDNGYNDKPDMHVDNTKSKL